MLQKLVTPEYVVHYCKRGFNVRMLGTIESNKMVGPRFQHDVVHANLSVFPFE